jgi:hypothetical protein
MSRRLEAKLSAFRYIIIFDVKRICLLHKPDKSLYVVPHVVTCLFAKFRSHEGVPKVIINNYHPMLR